MDENIQQFFLKDHKYIHRNQIQAIVFLILKTAEEIPQNIKSFLVKDETSPRLECKYAVKIDVDHAKKITYNTFHYIRLPK